MRSVEFGTRRISTISTVTFQPSSLPLSSPPRSTPSTASGWRPVSSESCRTASRTASPAFALLLRSALLCPPLAPLPAGLQPAQQHLDALVHLVVTDLAGVVRHLELGELAHDALLVV